MVIFHGYVSLPEGNYQEAQLTNIQQTADVHNSWSVDWVKGIASDNSAPISTVVSSWLPFRMFTSMYVLSKFSPCFFPMPCIQQLVALKSQDQSIATFPRLHLEEPSPLRSGGQQGLLLHLDRLREVFPGGLEVTHGILRLAVNPMPPPESPSSERASVQKKTSDTALLAGLWSQNWVH